LYINPSVKLFESLNEYLVWSGDKEYKTNYWYKRIVKLMEVINGGDYVEYLAKENKRIVAETKKRAKDDLKRLKLNIEKFYSYDTNNVYYTNQDYVRLSIDKERVETSQGVSVDVREARILYNLIVNKKDIVGFKIKDYTVISINGTLKIGCHNINIESMNRLGLTL